jgi:hypothetical protein
LNFWSHAKICKEGIFRVRNLPEKSQPSNEVNVTFEALSKVSFNNIEDVEISKGMYYQLLAKNYQSIDNYIHPNILFQITVAERHRVKQEGLRKYEKILNHSEKIRLYFVVPKERFETYKK